MAQGKMKVKAKPPANSKKPQKKGSAATRRANAPMKPKHKFQESHKLKQIITKTVNKAVEDDIRNKAGGSKLNLSKAQQAIANYNTDSSTATTKERASNS